MFMIIPAPAVVSVLVVIVLLDMSPVAATDAADTVPLAVRSVRLQILLLFMLTDMPSDMPVLLKLIMLWLSALISCTDEPFKVKVVPELM